MQYDHSSYSPRRTEPQSISWANQVSPTHSGGIPQVAQHSSPQQQPRRIQVKSTIDADIGMMFIFCEHWFSIRAITHILCISVKYLNTFSFTKSHRR